MSFFNYVIILLFFSYNHHHDIPEEAINSIPEELDNVDIEENQVEANDE